MNGYTRVLTIAGSDSGGGAGIQADLKTFAALGVYGLSVVTALTAQNTIGVAGIHEVPADFVGRQLDAVLSDIGADAVKIGMLSSPAIIHVVAAKLREYEIKTIVLDPVMVATSGDPLLRDDAMDSLRTELIPLASVITPNLHEAQILLGRTLSRDGEVQAAAGELLRLGGGAVLIKGGHFQDDHANDVLAWKSGEEIQVQWIKGRRINTNNTHGTGCTLSAAIAAFLAQGHSLVEAISRAKTYLSGALLAGASYTLGRGHGPVCHHYRQINFTEEETS